MIRFATRPVLIFAMVGLALMLTACGLKGPLDLPPAATPEQAQLDGQPAEAKPSPEGETPPQSPRKRIFLDWLLD